MRLGMSSESSTRRPTAYPTNSKPTSKGTLLRFLPPLFSGLLRDRGPLLSGQVLRPCCAPLPAQGDGCRILPLVRIIVRVFSGGDVHDTLCALVRVARSFRLCHDREDSLPLSMPRIRDFQTET